MSELANRIAALKNMSKDLVDVIEQNKNAFMTMPPMPQQGAPQQPPADPAMMQQGMPPVDPNTGMPIDPATGMPIDPNTGMPIDPAMMQQQGMPPIDPATGMPMADPAAQGGAPPAMGPDELAAAIDEIMGLLESEVSPAIGELDQRLTRLEQDTQKELAELRDLATNNAKMIEQFMMHQEVAAQGGWNQQ